MSAVPLLEVRELIVDSRRGSRAVDGISFDVSPGEILAIVGESGSGKTATARAVIGLLPPGLQVAGGAIRFQGLDLATLPPERVRKLRGPGLGMVFQEPMTSLNPALTIGRQMTEALCLHHGRTPAEARAAAVPMLARVGIRDPEGCLAAHPHQFSGGMRQRIMLASVMLLKPKLLIADEPTTALDTLTQADVLDLMVELARDNGTAVLFITHNLALVAKYADRALVMRGGHVVESGPAATLLRQPSHAYTRALVEALPRRGPARVPSTAAEPLIAAQGLCVDYAGRGRFLGRAPSKRAVDAVDLTVQTGEVVALVGGSGSGKTTLGRAMLRLVTPSEGRVLFRGGDVTALSGSALLPFRLACQIVFQDPYSSLDPRMRIADIVREPLRLVPGLTGGEAARQTDAMLDAVGLAGYGRRFPHELSGGQRQRVAIARALVRDPAFVVADEPVSALDMTIQAQILALFRRLQRERGFACLFISHDLAAVEEIADRIVVMEHGRLVEEGPRDRVIDAPAHAYTKALLAAAPRL